MTPWTVGSSVYGILQARTLGWVAPGALPNPGIEPGSPALQADSSPDQGSHLAPSLFKPGSKEFPHKDGVLMETVSPVTSGPHVHPQNSSS